MSQKPRFDKLSKTIQDRLNTKFSRQESISSADERWLDTDEGNIVDEQRVLDDLEAASDYERTVAHLDEKGKAGVKRLGEFAGDLVKPVGKKRDRSEYEMAAKEPKNLKKSADSAQPSTPIFTQKENATLSQRIEILDWHHQNGRNQSKTARHFAPKYPNLQIKQPLISAWLKNEAKWRLEWNEADTKSDRTAKRVRQTKHPQVTEMLELWLSKTMDDGIAITGDVLRQKWIVFADLAGIPENDRLKLSNRWLESFEDRYNLKEMRRHGEGASASEISVERERTRMQNLIKESGYEDCNIFNMDETRLFYGMAPDRGLSDRKRSGVKGKKLAMTYAFTSNADGSEKLPPFVIGKAARPRAFDKKSGAQLGFYYRNNAKAWMTANLYQEWLLNWDLKLQAARRKILLLQDNFSGHIVPAELVNIRVENFELNLTSHVQPMDQGIIRCFKAHYRAMFIQRSVDRYDEGVTLADIYDINQLQAMRLADLAWRDVDTTTIRNCWRKAGILPPDRCDSSTQINHSPSIPISSLLESHTVDPILVAEREVEDALNALVATGALQQRNRMDIESLLNSEAESYLITETSDKEIYQSVVDAVNAREDMEINGGDDVTDELLPLEPRPTRSEALKASLTIRKYFGHVDDPIVRKLEAILGPPNVKIRLDQAKSMKNAAVTDFLRDYS